MIQLPVTPANFPVHWSDTGTNSAIQAASTTREPSSVTPRMVSVNVPGVLAPWFVRPYQQTNCSPFAPVNTKGDPLPNSPVMVPSG